MAKKYKIIQDHEKCIGCGACVATCPDNWIMAKDGKAKPKKTEISEKEYQCNKQAAEVCPVNIIQIKEIK
ncbi:MAG: ferredoxin [Candidatus Pacearchaeota archaeon]|nr:ferredoxin [Candidatus Pacearchaeota archaeon]